MQLLFDRSILIRVGLLALSCVILEMVGLSLLFPFLGMVDSGKLAVHMQQWLPRLLLSEQTAILVLALLVCAGMTVKTLFAYIANRRMCWQVSQAQCDLIHGVVGRIMGAQYSYFLSRPPSETVNCISHHTTYAARCLLAVSTIATEMIILSVLGALF